MICKCAKRSISLLLIMITKRDIFLEQDFIERQTNCSAKHLVAKQFGKTPNSDRRRISKDIEEKISISILILDTSCPLPQPHARDDNEEDVSDAALYEVCQRQLRSTKCL